VTLALREGPHWRAGQQGYQTFAYVSTPLSPMPLFAADLETKSIWVPVNAGSQRGSMSAGTAAVLPGDDTSSQAVYVITKPIRMKHAYCLSLQAFIMGVGLRRPTTESTW